MINNLFEMFINCIGDLINKLFDGWIDLPNDCVIEEEFSVGVVVVVAVALSDNIRNIENQD